jgi:hypothetical protein
MGAQENRCATKISDSEGVEKHLDSEALWLFLDIPDIDSTNNAWTWPHETLLVNAILISENRSPFSEKHYKMYYFVGQEGFLLSHHTRIWVVPSPVHSAILGLSSKLIRQPRDGIAVLQGGE